MREKLNRNEGKTKEKPVFEIEIKDI